MGIIAATPPQFYLIWYVLPRPNHYIPYKIYLQYVLPCKHLKSITRRVSKRKRRMKRHETALVNFIYPTQVASTYLPSSLSRSKVLPSSRLAIKNHKLLIQHRMTPIQLCVGILKRLSIPSWNALRGIAMNVAVRGDVDLTRRSMETKTEKDPSAPHQIINQKKVTSKNGRCQTLDISPERRKIGVSMMIERRDV